MIHDYVKMIDQVTNFSKLHSFQYRLISSAIVLNKNLKLWNIHETGMCSNCTAELEDVIHFFINCQFAVEL